MPIGIYNHKPHTEETKKKISISHLGEKNPMFGIPSPFKGKHHSLKVKEKLSWLAKQRIGPLNPNWKEGRKIKSRNSRFKGYKKWREEGIKEFKGMCSMCGSNKDLIVDHPLPVSLFPEYALNPYNRRVLCKKCEMESDTYGGRVKKFTRKDFIDENLDELESFNKNNNF